MMRILYDTSPCGLPFFAMRKKHDPSIIAACIMGGVGLIGGGIASANNSANISAASNLNWYNRQWQSEEADIAREWNRSEWNRTHAIQMEDWFTQFGMQSDFQKQLLGLSNDLQQRNWQRQFEMQNAYNSPSAQINRLQQAGLNPSNVLGNSGNAAGLMPAPSAPAPSASSAPSPSVPVPNLAQILAGTPQTSAPHSDVNWATNLLGTLGGVAKDLASAGVDSTVIKQNMSTIEAYIKKAFNDADISELMKKSQSISNYIAENTKDAKVGQEWKQVEKLWNEIQEIASKIEVNGALKDNYNSDSDLKHMQANVAELMSYKVARESQLLGMQIEGFWTDFNNRQQNIKSSTAYNYSASSAQDALARLNNASAENQEFWNGLNQENRDELGRQIVLHTEQMSEQLGLTSQQTEVAKAMARNIGLDNDYYVARFWNDAINMYAKTGIDIFSEFTKFKAFKNLSSVQQQRVANEMKSLELQERKLNKKPDTKRHERYNANGDLIGFDFTSYE